MRNINTKFAGMAASLALILCVSATAEARRDAYHHYEGAQYDWQLTPEQQAQARQILNESYASLQNTREELAYKRSLLDQQLASSSPDSATIEKLSREIDELKGKMLAGRVAARSRLQQRGLPPDCLDHWGAPGYDMPMNNGWGRYGRHRGWHGGHHGYCDPCQGMGMMGGW